MLSKWWLNPLAFLWSRPTVNNLSDLSSTFWCTSGQNKKPKKVNFPLPTYISQKERFQIFFFNIPGLESYFSKWRHSMLMLPFFWHWQAPFFELTWWWIFFQIKCGEHTTFYLANREGLVRLRVGGWMTNEWTRASFDSPSLTLGPPKLWQTARDSCWGRTSYMLSGDISAFLRRHSFNGPRLFSVGFFFSLSYFFFATLKGQVSVIPRHLVS